jgi:hypothetical protein
LAKFNGMSSGGRTLVFMVDRENVWAFKG